MTNAYIYCRFSTPKQEGGDTLERQIRDCSAFCGRKGWDVTEVIIDKGRSAWKGDHLKGHLGAFADRVRAGEIPQGSVLVVEKLDRLSRQGHRVALRWIEDLCDVGLRVATVDGGKLYDAAWGTRMRGTGDRGAGIGGGARGSVDRSRRSRHSDARRRRHVTPDPRSPFPGPRQ